MQRSQEAIALAQALDHPFSLAHALSAAGAAVHEFRREVQAAQEQIEPLIRLSAEEGFVFYQTMGTLHKGWALAETGQVEAGIEQIRQGLTACQAMGTMLYRPHFLAWLAEGYGKAGQAKQGLSVLAEALAQVEKTDERFYEAELYRLKGELLLMQGDETEAEASFRNAIEVARRQQAKSWELRAAMSLCRPWQSQGKREEARQMLAEIYAWFPEGFDTPDLKEAKALLEELS